MPASAIATASQYLTFFLAGEEYGVDILQVTDIIECGAVTKVPGTPPWIRGVHNLRGAVVPVVDLAMKFGFPPTVVSSRSCIVIAELQVDDEPMVIGIMADSVDKVIDLERSEILPPPAFGSRVQISALLGVGRVDDKFVLLLDIDYALTASGSLAGGERSGIAIDAAMTPAEVHPVIPAGVGGDRHS